MKYVVLEAINEVFCQTICQFTALVWQHLEQYMISVNEDLVKQFVLGAQKTGNCLFYIFCNLNFIFYMIWGTGVGRPAQK